MAGAGNSKKMRGSEGQGEAVVLCDPFLPFRKELNVEESKKLRCEDGSD